MPSRLVVTPRGHGLGRKPDSPDPRDLRYSKVHRAHASMSSRVDLTGKLPPVFDQGQEGSCGANAGSALASLLWPDLTPQGAARQLTYWLVRHNCEGTGDEDGGVETRDILKVMQTYGSASERDWAYDQNHFAMQPTPEILAEAGKRKLMSYSRLVQTASYLDCLSSGYPFLLGFEVFESFDSAEIAARGIMTIPQAGEQMIGGHDVLVVGADLNFKESADFKKSGVDPALVSDRALLVRNSWGPDWGLKDPGHQGHFWMPMEFATNPSTAGDAWTGRLTPAPGSDTPVA